MIDWKEQILLQTKKLSNQEGIYTQGNIESHKNLKAYEKIGGTDFFSRAEIPGTHSFFDTRIIYHHLSKFCQNKNFSTILDLGCGDGRTVIWFLKNTQANIVALDGVFSSLLRLRKNYLDDNDEFQNRVLLLHSDILNPPLKDLSCDAIWAFESLYYLNEKFQQGLEQCHALLKPNGTLLNGERDKEIGLLHELLNDGVEGFLKSDENSTITDTWSEQEVKTPVFSCQEMERHLIDAGFEHKETLGLSFFSFIISFLRAKGLIKEDLLPHVDDLVQLMINHSLQEKSASRVNIFISQKRGVPC